MRRYFAAMGYVAVSIVAIMALVIGAKETFELMDGKGVGWIVGVAWTICIAALSFVVKKIIDN